MYNLIMGQSNTITFYYDVEENHFINENGCIVMRIHEFVPANVIFLFKNVRANMLWTNKELNTTVELIWPLSEIEDIMEEADYHYRMIL